MNQPLPSSSASSPPRPPLHAWRSIDELLDRAATADALTREFPDGASESPPSLDRRQFLGILGASLALASLGGCWRQPPEPIVPYVEQPENLTPGRPLFYATALPRGGFARPVLVEQHEGRPTKIEGNPDHPLSLGATDALTQAAILDLYDPDRSQSVTVGGVPSTWGRFLEAFQEAVARAGGPDSLRLRLLTGAITSPAAASQIQSLLRRFPQARWHAWEAAGLHQTRAGALAAFGRYVHPFYNFSRANRILSLDADFLIDDPASLRYAREFIDARRVRFKDRLAPAVSRLPHPPAAASLPTPAAMNRLYVIESTFSLTGAMADHRLAVPPSRIESLARQAAQTMLDPSLSSDRPHAPWIAAAAQDLLAHRGESLVLAGEAQPPAVHALAHAMNHALGNVGRTVCYLEPPEASPMDQVASLRDLCEALAQEEVDLLLIADGNPAYAAPADLEFAQHLETFTTARDAAGRFRHLSVRFGAYTDETSFLCHWHLPAAHALESWGDARAADGTVTLIQPLLAPLYDGKTLHELLAALQDGRQASGYDLLRRYWAEHWPGGVPADGFERLWRKALRDGMIPRTTAPAVETSLVSDMASLIRMPAASPAAPSAGAIELALRPDPSVWDGHFANNAWLQELPKPLTRLTWDNAAIMHPHTAAQCGIAQKDHPEIAQGRIVLLQAANRTLRVPVWLLPGHPEGVITLHLGYGRQHSGQVANGKGVNACLLRTTQHLWSIPHLQVQPTPDHDMLAATQQHQLMHGRDLARSAPVNHPPASQPEVQDLESQKRAADGRTVHLSLYPENIYTGYRWGMVIDLTACIGCNACVMACQAENNIPIVGKQQVGMGRAMHWLRIDTYFVTPGDQDHWEQLADPPEIRFQPMLCQHCENAPCEVVCPVGATTHSAEGINEMTYNRCIGTRYCSNNCPYKVRRFNFFEYNDRNTEVRKMQRNPDVTVRSRGVMEKCTYCIQRINQARIDAKKAWGERDAAGDPPLLRTPPSAAPAPCEPLPPLNVLTACQQACPTEAIVFGDMNDAQACVYRLKTAEPFASLNYGVLTELNTQPRTTYLMRLRNPNPEVTRT